MTTFLLLCPSGYSIVGFYMNTTLELTEELTVDVKMHTLAQSLTQC